MELPFKKPSKKYQPKGLTVLYDDKDIIVVHKENGLLTMASENEKEKTAYFLMNEYVKKGNSKSRERVFIVHRLDRDTSGVLVFAKSEKAKKYLQSEWENFTKNYCAVVLGKLKNKEGIIESYLLENKMFKVFSVKTASEEAKFAKTEYQVLKENADYSLVNIKLHTGRKNQIRVHFADLGNPVVGDKVYGKKDKGYKRLCLHAEQLTILHPFTKKEITFKAPMPVYFKQFFNEKNTSK